MKRIEILVGIPCSGKSTYAWSRLKHLMGTLNTPLIVSRDIIRDIHFNKPYYHTKENESKVSLLFDDTIEETNCSYIILDNTHCKEKYIDQIIQKYSNVYKIHITFFDCNLFIAHLRNIFRFRETFKWIPIKVINNMYKNYKKINRSKYAKYISV